MTHHALEDDHGDTVAYPVVFLDGFHGWVRELASRDHRGWFEFEPITQSATRSDARDDGMPSHRAEDHGMCPDSDCGYDVARCACGFHLCQCEYRAVTL